MHIQCNSAKQYLKQHGLTACKYPKCNFKGLERHQQAYRVLTCSPSEPMVRNASQARPPAMPNRRVRKEAIASVVSASRFLFGLDDTASAAGAAAAGWGAGLSSASGAVDGTSSGPPAASREPVCSALTLQDWLPLPNSAKQPYSG